jgi:hypothetical protein
MPRLPEYDTDQIVRAAGRLIASSGPGAATIGAIARAVGAPTGSIYHRFRSRDVLLAEVWLLRGHGFPGGVFPPPGWLSAAARGARGGALHGATGARETAGGAAAPPAPP